MSSSPALGPTLDVEPILKKEGRGGEGNGGEECCLSTVLWENGEGFTSITMPGLCLKERCIGIRQAKKDT